MRYACCKLKQDPMHAPADTADLPPKKPLRNQNVSKAKIAALPAVIDSELCFSQLCGENCPVCLGDFEVGEEVRRLPCFHFFHDVCIGPWLMKHSATCPLCNFDVGAIFDGKGDGRNIVESATNNNAELHEQLYFAL
ncbi:hypothetical protein BX661DRAFT_183829 [Kickxella alabastrina]|uniref:uncharacterized protein n=1 Tax=Kickxella alabastrina TaxID=61397 RepID=UPI0022207810|nr:uncharacterized protein BX661DRAFT_183829 [Kickxella alabastrina]KAI7826347.1 hypothetical protein BX661DRAFT_183829 [Kickxella alabastrina]